MKSQKVRIVSLIMYSAFLWNCSLDTHIILQHRQQANPGTEMTVELVNGYIRMEQTSQVSEDVVRDSIHVGIGLPAGWSVKEVLAYAAPHYRPFKTVDTADLNEDLEILYPQLMDSLQVYKARQQQAPEDPGMNEFFTGREFTVSDWVTDDEYTLDPDTVDSWTSFGAEINLTLSEDDPMDFVTANEDTSIETDSIGYLMIPVFITATLQVGGELGDYRLYYYSKSGALPQSVGELELDIGQMTSHPLEVKDGTGTGGRFAGALQRPVLRVKSGPGEGMYRISLFTPNPSDRGVIHVYNAAGEAVRTFRTAVGSSAREQLWDGRDFRGNTAGPGVYILNAVTGSGGVSGKLCVPQGP